MMAMSHSEDLDVKLEKMKIDEADAAPSETDTRRDDEDADILMQQHAAQTQVSSHEPLEYPSDPTNQAERVESREQIPLPQALPQMMLPQQ